MTKIISISPKNPEPDKIKQAAELIKRGEVVAFPTETVYGLGADALNPKAIRKIFEVKGRPSDNPLIMHIAEAGDLKGLVSEIPLNAKRLIDKFWPGPLTIVFKKKPVIPDEITAGLDTVAARMPSNKIALALIRESGTPIAAPSANISGRPSSTDAKHVLEDFEGKIPLVVDGGDCDVGLESTVVDLTEEIPTLLRPGSVTLEQLKEVLGEVKISSHSAGEKVKSPGMKYRHYSPRGKLILVEGEMASARKKIEELVLRYKKERKKVSTLHLNREDLKNSAKNLFRMLREKDYDGVEIIIAEGVNEKEIGLAVMNRLRKAASEIIKI